MFHCKYMEEKQKEKKSILEQESKILNKKWVRIVLIVLLILLVLWLLYSTTDMTIKLPF